MEFVHLLGGCGYYFLLQRLRVSTSEQYRLLTYSPLFDSKHRLLSPIALVLSHLHLLLTALGLWKSEHLA